MKRCTAAGLCAILTACSATDTPNGVAVTDSAGVSIVAIPESLLVEAPVHTLSEPLLTLGGSPDSDVAWIVSTLLLDDGGIAFINGAGSEVRIHGADGEERARVGRNGTGPGEFEAPWRLFEWAGDSIAVWDVQLRRITILTADGRPRTFQVSSLDGAAPQVHATMAGGFLLAGAEDRYKERDQNRVRRDTLGLYRVSTLGGETLPAGRYAGDAQYEMAVPPVVLLESAPFGTFSSVGVMQDRIVVADNAVSQITVSDETGSIARILRFGMSPKPVTAADRRAFEQANINENWRPTYLAAKRQFIAEAPIPAGMPRMGELIVGADGTLWLAEYVPEHERSTVTRTWWVLSADGAIRGRVVTPARFTLHGARGDRIIGVQRDELDVESVVVYRIDIR
jgi:hypothetical protein